MTSPSSLVGQLPVFLLVELFLCAVYTLPNNFTIGLDQPRTRSRRQKIMVYQTKTVTLIVTLEPEKKDYLPKYYETAQILINYQTRSGWKMKGKIINDHDRLFGCS